MVRYAGYSETRALAGGYSSRTGGREGKGAYKVFVGSLGELVLGARTDVGVWHTVSRGWQAPRACGER
jgi:hypothetical protein